MPLVPASWRANEETPFGPGAARVLQAFAVVAPTVGVIAPKGFIWMSLALAIALTARDVRSRALMPHFPRALAVLFAGVIGWSAVTLLWAAHPGDGADKLSGLALYAAGTLALLAAGRGMDAAARRRLALALSLGIALSFALMFFERFNDFAVLRQFKDLSGKGADELYSQYNRAAAINAVLVWPCMIWLWRLGRRAAAAGLLALGFAAMAALDASSVLLSLLLGAAAAAVVAAWRAPRLATAIGTAAFALVLAAPWATLWAVDRFAPADRAAISGNLSVNHRIIIWEFASRRIAERPLAGHGFYASRSIPGGREKVPLLAEMPEPLPGQAPQMPRGDMIPLHPHSAPLQWWLELGLPGAAMGGLLLLFLFRAAGALSGALARAFACAQITTGAAISALAWGAWQVWWLAVLALAAWVWLVLNAEEPSNP